MSISGTPSPTSTQDKIQENRAFTVSIVFLVAVTANLILSLSQGFQTGAWQHYLRAGVVILFGLAIITAMILIRRRRVNKGLLLIIYAMLITLLLTSLLLAGFGPALALIALILAGGIATFMVAKEKKNRTLIITGIAAALIYGVDLLPLNYRIVAPTVMKGILPIIGALVIISIAVLVILQFERYSLRGKLLIIFVGVTSAVLLITGTFFIFNTASVITNQEENNQITRIKSQKEAIDNFLFGAHADVLFLSKTPVLSRFLNTPETSPNKNAALKALESEFLTFIQINTFYDQIRFLDTTGQEIVRVNKTSDGNAEIVAKENLQNKAGRYYFDDSIILSKGDVFVSLLDLNVEDGKIEVPHKPMLRYATPVYIEGTLQGVVITNLLAENFMTLLGSDKSNTFLVDKDGYYLYHPEQSKRWGRDLETEIKINQDYPILANELFTGQTGTVKTDKFVFAYTPVILKDQTSPSWYLANQVSLSEATAPVERTVIISILVLITMMIIATFVIFYLSGLISSPIIELTKTAERLSSGEYGITADIQSSDEIGALTKTFNTMSTQLRELIETLEQRVADRTRALEISTEVSRRLSTILDKDQLVKEVVEQLVTAFGYYYAHIYFFEDDENTLVMKGGTGEAGKALLARGHTIPKGRGLVGRAAESNMIVLVGDTLNEEGWLPNDLLPETRAEIAVPISLGDKVLGVFDVQHNVLNGLTEEDADLLQSIANQVAIAVRNAETHLETQRRAEHEALIGNINQQIQSATTIEDALKVTIRELGRALGTETSVRLGSKSNDKNN